MFNEQPRSTYNPDDQQNSGLTPAERQQYIAYLQQALDKGQDITPYLGVGLHINNGRVEPKGFWDASKGDLAKIALLAGGGAIGGLLSGGTNATTTAASSTGAVGPMGSTLPVPALDTGGTSLITNLMGAGQLGPGGVPGFVGPILDTVTNPSGSILSKILGVGKSLLGKGSSQGPADLSSVLGGLKTSEMDDRFKTGVLTQNYDRLVQDAATTNRAQEADAIKKLAQASYIQGGGAQPINRMMHSGTIPDFGFGPKPASADQMQGMSTLKDELLKRLTPAGQIAPTAPDYLKPGALEKTGKYGSLGSSLLGTAKTIWGQ